MSTPSRIRPASADLRALAAQGPAPTRDLGQLIRFAEQHPRLFVLTGAGCSTASGIPDYRTPAGDWKRAPPVTAQAFVADPAVRQRYWARSFVGWPMFGRAQPGPAHRALAQLEAAGRVTLLVTQNVDRLHQGAGSRQVIDLHGRLDRVLCLDCRRAVARAQMQQWLHQANPDFLPPEARQAPDGDADLARGEFENFQVPACPDCGGILKPEVVFYGDAVPRERIERALQALEASDAVLVAGSSLMVWSGLRFVRDARASGRPVAMINQGLSRGDDCLTLKLEADCGEALGALVRGLGLTV